MCTDTRVHIAPIAFKADKDYFWQIITKESFLAAKMGLKTNMPPECQDGDPTVFIHLNKLQSLYE